MGGRGITNDGGKADGRDRDGEAGEKTPGRTGREAHGDPNAQGEGGAPRGRESENPV